MIAFTMMVTLCVGIPVGAQTRHRRVVPPKTQGYFAGYWGSSAVELRGLRVPVVIKTQSQRTILLLADYWATIHGAQLRVVSGMDHIHARHSAHYKGMAIDIQAPTEVLDALAIWFKGWGYRVLWRTRGHWHHVHIEELE